jgi:hypothetical protein
MPVNTRLLRIEVSRQAERQIGAEMDKLIKSDFKAKRDELMNEFDTHPVTEEIKAGPRAMSRYVSSSEGNLFSFLGFDADQKPISALRSWLKQNIKLGVTRRKRKNDGTIEFTTPVEIPTLEDADTAMSVDTEAKLSWIDRSFVSLIERGITGLPNYLFSLTKNLRNSRSGTAIQTKSKIRSGSLGRISYISGILSNFKRRITGGR